jgi:hypothetical protein
MRDWPQVCSPTLEVARKTRWALYGRLTVLRIGY